MRNVDFDKAGLMVFERGWLSSNNVLLFGDGNHETVLVDSGYCTQADQTVALVRHALGGKPLQRVVNTHLHSDHCGGNRALQLAWGCRIDIPAAESAKVDAWNEASLSYAATGQECPRFLRDGLIAEGRRVVLGLHEWDVVATPGHDDASVALYQPELEILISADALWENGFGVVFPELEGVPAFDDVRRTLDKLAGLRARWVIPGHGAPFSDLSGAIARARSRLEAFEASPARHARHAAKVLLKFRLMDLREIALGDLLAWMASVHVLRATHRVHFGQTDFGQWSSALISELSASNALTVVDGCVRNR